MITLVLYSINVILRSGWSNNVVAISPLSPWCSSMTECESFWWIHEQLWPWQVQIIFGLLTFPKPKPWFSFSIWNPLPIKTFFLAMQSWGQMAGLSRSSESQTSSGQVRESLEQVEYVKLLVLNNKNWNWNSWSLKLVLLFRYPLASIEDAGFSSAWILAFFSDAILGAIKTPTSALSAWRPFKGHIQDNAHSRSFSLENYSKFVAATFFFVSLHFPHGSRAV